MLKDSKLPKTKVPFSLDRCKALADGIFAIAVTLLVLGIDVPTNHRFSEQGLFAFLDRISFDMLIYAISFWLAGTYWVQHAAIMRYFKHGSRGLIWLNLLFLFFITLLPFVTELKGDYRLEPLVTMLFAIVQILIGLALIALWRYAVSHPHLLNYPVEEMIQRRVTWRMIVSPIIMSIIAVPLSFYNVHLGSFFFLIIPLYYLSHHAMDQNWSDIEMR